MLVADMVHARIDACYPKKLREGSRVVLVESPTEWLNTVWKVEEKIEKDIMVGPHVVKVVGFVLRRGYKQIEALPYPLGRDNQFLKWNESHERKKLKKQKQETAMQLSAQQRREVDEKLDEVIAKRSPKQRRILKGFDEL